MLCFLFFFFSSRRRHTRCLSDWSSDVCSSDLDGDRARREDVGVEAAAVEEVVDDAGPRERLQVEAGLAELDAEALDRADHEALADEVVQPHAADDDLTPGLHARQRDVLERFRLDQRQRSSPPLAVGTEVAVTLEAAARDRPHEVDRTERLRRPDVDLLDGACRRSHTAQATRTSGVTSESDSTTASDSATASPGGKCAFGIATQRIPAAFAERMPLCESSIAVHSCGSAPRRRATSR